jgi:hypothetical protein
MRILSAAKLGEINRNEIKIDSNVTNFTPLVSLIFRLRLQPSSPIGIGEGEIPATQSTFISFVTERVVM